MPKNVSYPTLRDKILQPALTTHYDVNIQYGDNIRNWINDKFKAVFAGSGVPSDMRDTLSISCCDATLPGSTFFTHEIQNDRTGVTEKLPYRRIYDDQANFTFYVDKNYSTLVFLEGWKSYIANEQYGSGPGGVGIESKEYFYRMRYPEEPGANYRVPISITKFERNHQLLPQTGQRQESSKELKYNFVNAYPLSINSIPISYEMASTLKVTVSFAFTRYYLG